MHITLWHLIGMIDHKLKMTKQSYVHRCARTYGVMALYRCVNTCAHRTFESNFRVNSIPYDISWGFVAVLGGGPEYLVVHGGEKAALAMKILTTSPRNSVIPYFIPIERKVVDDNHFSASSIGRPDD